MCAGPAVQGRAATGRRAQDHLDGLRQRQHRVPRAQEQTEVPVNQDRPLRPDDGRQRLHHVADRVRHVHQGGPPQAGA
eukprot:4053846-Prymnesium_polylepis.1